MLRAVDEAVVCSGELQRRAAQRAPREGLRTHAPEEEVGVEVGVGVPPVLSHTPSPSMRAPSRTSPEPLLHPYYTPNPGPECDCGGLGVIGSVVGVYRQP